MSRPSGRPSNSATNSDPGTFVFAEPLFLIPFGSSTGRPGGDVRRECIFSEEPVSLMPWGSDWQPGNLGGTARPEPLPFFSPEPLFLIPFGSLPARQGGDVRRE